MIDVLCDGSLSYLRAVYSESSGLFPYSTRLRGGVFINDFSHAQTNRYTVNSLLGLQAAARVRPHDPWLGQTKVMIERFLELHYASLSPADLGLLLVLLAEENVAEDLQRDALRRIAGAVAPDRSAGLVLQDLSWMLWGTVAVAKGGLAGGDEIARGIFERLTGRFVNEDTRLPRHSHRLYRRNIVSFGGLVYFLRAMHEYESLTSAPHARSLFASGVRSALGLQAEGGEWPWMIDVRTREPFDLYPVFSVHQDSMAMLFLLPALDQGMPEVSKAVERSLAWVEGRNELGMPMYIREPAFFYRSVERVERLPRVRRYLRSFRRPIAGSRAAGTPGAHVRLNDECRSYHPGWILYAWSGRTNGSSG